jgi:hypothetical protein
MVVLVTVINSTKSSWKISNESIIIVVMVVASVRLQRKSSLTFIYAEPLGRYLYILYQTVYGRWDGIVISYCAVGWECKELWFGSQRGQRFLSPVLILAVGSTQPRGIDYWGSSTGVKRPRCEADHVPYVVLG